MNRAVVDALMRCFENKRLVFWYDEGGKCRAEFDEIVITGVNKLVIANNEFGIKYKVLKNQQDKFLIYSPNAKPSEADDWLLDLYLMAAHFSTSPSAMIINEMRFPDTEEMRCSLTEPMLEFFNSIQRKGEVRKLLDSLGHTPTVSDIMLAMICVVCGVGEHLKIEYVLFVLLKELAEDKSEKIDELASYGLERAFWKRISIDYGYQNVLNPSIVDFANKIFHDAFYPEIRDEAYKLSHTALSFFKDWKNGVKTREIFKVLSNNIASKLNVAQDIENVNIDEFGSLDIFREIDEQIVKSLVAEAERGSMRYDDAARLIGMRKDGCYWKDFEDEYLACEAAIKFFEVLSNADLTSSDAEDAINKYSNTWYQIDQQYRLFIEYYNKAKKINDNVVDLFAALKNKIDGFYVNNYLMKQSVSFQGHLNRKAEWKFDGIKMQQDFWRDWIVYDKRKVCVIISDALRYEIGKELAATIEATHRYSAEITPMVSAIPSYTQLGMAALLPHKQLDLVGGADRLLNEWVYVDGKLTNGLDARKMILEAVNMPRATAINYKDVMNMTKTECRKWQSSANVLYVYHNVIDSRGDKRETEDETTVAAREAISEIEKLIAKVGGDYHITKFIVTADHGFLYQDCPLDESQYVADEECIACANVSKSRFVIGKSLVESQVLVNYKSEQLGLEPGVDIRIAKGIMRMRRQGSGVKFVHGGTSLQEILVPVVEIRHVRTNEEDVTPVDADILIDGNGCITTNRFNVSVYQVSPVGDKFLKRRVKLSLQTKDGVLLSNEVELWLDSTATTVQDRTKSTFLTLNQAANRMQQGSVVLKMDTGRERKNGIFEYDEYKKRDMTLKLAVVNFFD